MRTVAMAEVTCQSCGFVHSGASCPRCARIDAILAADPPSVPVVIPGPSSDLTNTLSTTRHAPPPSSPAPSPVDDGILRYAARPAPAPQLPVTQPLPVAHPLPDEIECPRCAERIKARAKVCRFCAHELEPERGSRRRSSSRLEVHREVVHHYHHAQATSPGFAAFLSFLFVGLGQIYAGHVGRGVVFMFAQVLLIAIGFMVGGGPDTHDGRTAAGLLALIGWLVNIFDALNCAGSSTPGDGIEYRGRRR